MATSKTQLSVTDMNVFAAFAARNSWPPSASVVNQLIAKYKNNPAGLDQYVRQHYPASRTLKPAPRWAYSYLGKEMGSKVNYLAVPEVARILFTSAAQGWLPDKTSAAIQNTSWWKGKNETQRGWAERSPADQHRDVEQVAVKMASTYNRLWGTNRSPSEFMRGALQVANGNTDFGIWEAGVRTSAERKPNSPAQRELAQEQAAQLQRGVDIENLAGKLSDAASQQYLLPVDRAAMSRWAQDIIDNKSSQQDWTDWARGQASGMYSAYATQIQNGVDPSTLFSTYKQMASKELERPVEYGDSVLTDALMSQEPVTLSMYQRQLRQRPEWSKTAGANDMAASFASRIASTFGESSIG